MHTFNLFIYLFFFWEGGGYFRKYNIGNSERETETNTMILEQQ